MRINPATSLDDTFNGIFEQLDRIEGKLDAAQRRTDAILEALQKVTRAGLDEAHRQIEELESKLQAQMEGQA